jgi:hypothetical protein
MERRLKGRGLGEERRENVDPVRGDGGRGLGRERRGAGRAGARERKGEKTLIRFGEMRGEVWAGRGEAPERPGPGSGKARVH